jgi:hypothetical protein
MVTAGKDGEGMVTAREDGEGFRTGSARVLALVAAPHTKEGSKQLKFAGVVLVNTAVSVFPSLPFFLQCLSFKSLFP